MAKLGEVCKVSPSTKNIERQGAWLLNLDMVEQQTGRVIEYKYVGEDDLNGSIIQFDTENVLYSKLRPNLNKVVLPQKDGFSTSELLPLRPDASVLNKDYLAVFLRSDSFVTWAVSKTAGAKMPRLGTKDLMNAEIPVPSIEQQKKIAEKFKKLEQLISLRKQQLAKLDELVKARFVEMFGDPSNNPMGWKKQNFEDIALLITDGEHMTPQRTNKGIYLLSARNILNHTIQLDDVDYIDEEEYGRIARRIVPQQGDVLVSCSGSIGRCCVVPSELKFQMVRSVALIRFNNTINPIFAEWLIATDELQKQIYTSATQSSQANLFQGKIRKLCGYVPPLSLQNQFATFVERVDQQKQTVQRSLEKLELMKKALMQEYFG